MTHFENSDKKILIVRLSSIGDIVLSTLLVRILRKTYPKAKLGFLTKAVYKDILDCMPKLDERYAFHFNSRRYKAQVKDIMLIGWTTVIDLQNNWRSRRITKAIGVKEVYRFHRARWNRFIRIYLPFLRGVISEVKPVALQYLECASVLKLQDDGLGLELKPQDKALENAKRLLSEYHNLIEVPTDTKPLVIAPSALHPTKMWLPEKWVDTLNRLYLEGFKSQVIIGSGDDMSIASYICEKANHKVLNLCGIISLADCIAIIASAVVFLGGDTGPMHIASALGVPVVSIFGPTVPEFGFAPFRVKSIIVQCEDLKCRPCSPHGSKRCPKRNFRCMEDIQPEKVKEAVYQVLSIS